MPDRILASSSSEWRDSARAMLETGLPDALIQPVGEDLLAISAEGLSITDVASSVASIANPFVRHLFREIGRIEAPSRQSLDVTLDAIVDVWANLPVPLPPAVSLQVWASGPVDLAFRPDTLRRELETMLRENGTDVARAGSAQVLSACIAGNQILLGLNGVTNSLSDWPGGRVRLSKPKGQISRSEFKLEELFRTTDLQPPKRGLALDLGASPGGWTRILRGYGLEVVAVDPADLDPRLRGDRGIRHVRTTSGPFLRETRDTFDVVVNDMRMDPAMSVGLMIDAAAHLRPGGMLIMTLKLSHHAAIRTVQNAVDRLGDVVDIRLVRQLHHNRNEVTMVGIRSGD